MGAELKQDTIQYQHRCARRDAKKVRNLFRWHADRDPLVGPAQQHAIPRSKGAHLAGDVAVAGQARKQGCWQGHVRHHEDASLVTSNPSEAVDAITGTQSKPPTLQFIGHTLADRLRCDLSGDAVSVRSSQPNEAASQLVGSRVVYDC